MDTCGPRTVDHGALLAYGLLRLPTAAACPATAAHTGCAYPRVSRGHANFVDVGFVGIDGASAAAAHDKRDFVVFLSLSRKTQKNKHQTSNHRSTHILVTCYSTVILLPLRCAPIKLKPLLFTPLAMSSLELHRIASRTQRTQIPHLHFYVINSAETPDSRRVEAVRKAYCTVIMMCDD